MISDEEYLERIVAGIHTVTTKDADVSWNEKINGRQFDVVIRFKLGTLRYLVLIEVKDRSRKAEAEHVEAFITKAGDHKADKVVFVTSAGFQAGAIAVAKRHNVALFTVTFAEGSLSLPRQGTSIIINKKGAAAIEMPTLSVGPQQLISNIESMTLTYDNGRQFELPNERSQMTYYVNQTKTHDGRSLAAVVEAAKFTEVDLDQRLLETIEFDPALAIEPPDNYFFPSGKLVSLHCELFGIMSRPITGNTRIDPDSFRAPVIYRDVITGEESQFELDQLPLGTRRLSVGKFYFTYNPLRYYYCEAIRGDVAHVHMVESFQCGEKVNSTFTMLLRHSSHYIPVSDVKTLNRLQSRLEEYRTLRAKSA